MLHNPTTKLDYHLKETRLPRAVLTEKEVRRLLDEAQKDSSPRGLRDRAVLEFLYATGLRATELANLTPWDVNLEERTLRIDQGKGRKDRNVPLTTAACEAIEAYLELGRPALVRKKSVPYLFLANEGGWLHRAVLSRLIARYAVRARIWTQGHRAHVPSLRGNASEIRGHVDSARTLVALQEHEAAARILQEEVETASGAGLVPIELEARVALSRLDSSLAEFTKAAEEAREAVRLAEARAGFVRSCCEPWWPTVWRSKAWGSGRLPRRWWPRPTF